MSKIFAWPPEGLQSAVPLLVLTPSPHPSTSSEVTGFLFMTSNNKYRGFLFITEDKGTKEKRAEDIYKGE